MQLEDVERLEKLHLEWASKSARVYEMAWGQRRRDMLEEAESLELRIKGKLFENAHDLLALAREALERRRDAEAASDDGAALSAHLHEMMRDPRYWRDRDPEHVARVTAGFRKLFPG